MAAKLLLTVDEFARLFGKFDSFQELVEGELFNYGKSCSTWSTTRRTTADKSPRFYANGGPKHPPLTIWR